MAGFPTAGDHYGRYRIVAEIGHGGMGVVYEALDTVLNRLVALKIVLPSLTDRDELHQRFAHEAEALAKIKSRNIVGIYDYGEHEDTVFFATEYFPEGDLQSWLATHGPMDRRAALALTAQVCEALADAHDAGVVHRDVKPGNVLLWNRPEGLVPYLADFGIAIESRPGTRSGLTRTGALVGSPAYMAPERHFGHPADERGDVYSAGCLLWAALTGDAPYSGTDFQMMNSHINGSVPGLRTGQPVDDRIDQVLAGALDKDPDHRIPTAAAFRAQLLEIVRDIDNAVLPISRPPQAPAPRSAPVDDRTQVRVVAAPPVAGAAAAGGTGSSAPVRDGSGRRRGWWVAAAVAAAVAIIVGVTTLVVNLASSDPDDATDPPVASSPSVGSPTTAEPLPAPDPPTVRAQSDYRKVVFSVAATEGGADTRTEVKRDGVWAPLTKPQESVPTKQGGVKVCLDARTVLEQDGVSATSEPTTTCAKAQERTATLTATAEPCTESSNGFSYPCRYYALRLGGYASGSAPLAQMKPKGAQSFCKDFDCPTIPVGPDGRAADLQFTYVFDGTTPETWILNVDGITDQVVLAP